MLNQFRGWEWLILLALLLLLFGAKRLPDTARGLGRSLRIFKAETKGLVDGDPEGAAGLGAPLQSDAPKPLDSGSAVADRPVADR